MKHWVLVLIALFFFAGCGDSESGSESGEDAALSQLEDAGAITDEGTLPQLDSSSVEDSATVPDVQGDPLAECADQIIPALQWFDLEIDEAMSGSFEFGQTHVVRQFETREAPILVSERETLLLFYPDSALSESRDFRLVALEKGKELGVIKMSPPSKLPGALEQALTPVELTPYSEQAWSATLPWDWVRNGVQLKLGVLDEDKIQQAVYEFKNLGAPHSFTVTRTHMVLFGEDDFEVVAPRSTSMIARQFHASMPGSELRWVNSSHWRLDRMVVNTSEGPRWASSEAERLAITSDKDRWSLLKNQTALRLSLANTGRGLGLTTPPEGDNSPYSFGTSVAQGWVHEGEGAYADINNAGLAAGWTGWTGMWLDDCGNGLIHELGHSFTLLHFTEGVAVMWGIVDEYPKDGTNLETHPWGYDTVQRAFRTWYRVDAAGPVQEGGALVGKRDPMNGGESPNRATCFPQFTAYHAKWMQDWEQDKPTIANIGGTPGIYRWDEASGSYLGEGPVVGNQRPIKVGGPVVTVIGTLGNIDEVCQTYPPVFIPSGNVFEMPDPMNAKLPGLFHGSRWFLEVEYGDGSKERAIIKVGEILESNTGLYLYSLNLDATREPKKVDLYRAAAAYPEFSMEEAELVHSRAITPPLSQGLTQVVSVGRGQLANGEIRLTEPCDAGFNCDFRAKESVFLDASSQISFTRKGDEDLKPALCATQGAYSSWTVPVLSEFFESTEVVVHAQRVLSGAGNEISVPADDQTPWLSYPGMSQSLRVWIPYEENKGLPEGRYRSLEKDGISVLKDGEFFSSIPLRLDLEVRTATQVSLPPNYQSPGLSIPSASPDSSIYYLFEDPGMGPAQRKWWGDDSGNLISVPVLDQETGEPAVLTLRGHKIACDNWWEINTGQSKDWGCSHSVHLQLEPGANDSLIPGHTYSSPGSQPVVIKGMRWHEPNAGQVLGTLVLDITHKVPGNQPR